MIRSLIVIALAIVCGAAAAFGVNQFIRNQPAPETRLDTTPVICASQPVPRGDVVTEDMLKESPWPTTLVPSGVFKSKKEVAGRTAKETIMEGEPIFAAMVTDQAGGGAGFVASIVTPTMRAYTIQTKGASSSVAGFIRPRDHVDVLLHLRGGTNDETGGGSTSTLLQNVEVLAIDRILDSNVDTMQKLEMWAKGDNFTSVTLLVKPEDATRLFLGQTSGELSLALRNANDDQPIENPTVATIRQIRYQERAADAANGEGQSDSAGDGNPPAPFPDVPVADAIPGQKRAPDAYIHTLRGDQVGRVPVAVNR